MLACDDIGRLFAVLRSAYGHKWPHAADAIPVWMGKLKKYTATEVMRAASRVIEIYSDPPSIGQFLSVLKAARPQTTTYMLPAPFDQANADKAWDHMEKLAGKPLRPAAAGQNEKGRGHE